MVRGPSPKKPTRHLAADDVRSYLRVLHRNPRLTRLWLAGVISHIGNGFTLSLFVFFLLNKPIQADSELVFHCQIHAFFFMGTWCRRCCRPITAQGGDLLRTLIVLSCLHVDAPSRNRLVYVLALSHDTVWTVTDPARQASIANSLRRRLVYYADSGGGAALEPFMAWNLFGEEKPGHDSSHRFWFLCSCRILSLLQPDHLPLAGILFSCARLDLNRDRTSSNRRSIKKTIRVFFSKNIQSHAMGYSQAPTTDCSNLTPFTGL